MACILIFVLIAITLQTCSATVASLPTCEDNSSICATSGKFCTDPLWMPSFKINCQKTCGFCPVPSFEIMPAKKLTGNCEDANVRCPVWVKNNFCNNINYTEDVKRKTCGFSCGLCL